MLFLVDKKNGDDVLRGELAIGPLTHQEGQGLWDQFEITKVSRESDLNSLLLQTERFSDEVREGKCSDAPLSSEVKKIVFPIGQMAGAIAECLKTGVAVKVRYGQSDPFRVVIDQLTRPNDVPHAFVSVPLAGKHTGRIGALVVDNRFLWREREIGDDDIEGLQAFAGLLGFTIENTRLRQRMAEDQAAGFIHIVEKRIGSARNSVPKLRKCASVVEVSHLANDIKDLLITLEEDLREANKIFKQFRTFASPVQLHRRDLDLRVVLEELRRRVPQGIECKFHMPPSALTVRADSSVLLNAFVEILTNALEATEKKADPTIEIKAWSEQIDGVSHSYAGVEMKDNGPGIPDDIINTLFEQFVTKGKPDGTGLGLANARKFILEHGGTIECANSSGGGGARFIIRLPLLSA